MKNATKTSRTDNPATELADLGTLFDGSALPPDGDEGGDAPTPCADTHVPQPPPPASVPEVIHPSRFRLITEMSYIPGEDAWSYLNRITPHLLTELVGMAMAPLTVVNAKTKLDALRELIQRPMPARQVVDIHASRSTSEFDRMTDEQVKEYVATHLGLAAPVPDAPALEDSTPAPIPPEDTPKD